MSDPSADLVHPLWLRCAHWLNAVAAVLMVLSGWRIYNASPFLAWSFPREWTLGGWLGGALQWHFAAMWLLMANGVIYVALGLATGRLRRKLLPVRAGELIADLRGALRGQLAHADLAHYNAPQKLAYLVAIADLAVLVLSGLVLWKSVQFPVLRELLGGYEGARRVHFGAMTVLVAFVAVHVAMVVLVPRTLIAMLRGR